MARGQIYLYTGEGGGKTTTALGLAMRSIGWDHRVVMIQWLKGRKAIGEWKVQEKLKGWFKVYQYGRPQFMDPKNPQPIDYELARKGLAHAKQILSGKNPPELLILDELNLAVRGNLVELDDVLTILKRIPPKTTVVITGRYARKELIDIADFVNVVKILKQPFEKGVMAKKGIQY